MFRCFQGVFYGARPILVRIRKIAFGDIIVNFLCKGIDWSGFDGGKGEPLVFLHGFPFDQRLYRSSSQPLTDSYRVIIPDLPGFGESRFRPGFVPNRFEMSEYADGLAELLDKLGESKALVCGLSMGGYIAMQFFRRHLDRLSGLIFCDTRSTPDSPVASKKRSLLADSVYQTGVRPLAAQMIPSLLSPTTLSSNQEIVIFLTEMISEQDPSGVAAAARGMAVRDDSTAYLKEITVPTLFLAGEHDQISPPQVMREMAEAVADSEFLTVPDSGHLPPLENPAFFTKAVRRFADRVYNRA